MGYIILLNLIETNLIAFHVNRTRSTVTVSTAKTQLIQIQDCKQQNDNRRLVHTVHICMIIYASQFYHTDQKNSY